MISSLHLHLKDLLEIGVLDPQPPDRGGTQALQREGDDKLSHTKRKPYCSDSELLRRQVLK